MSESIEDVIFHISPAESPIFSVRRFNKRRLGRKRKSIRGIKRRLSNAQFSPSFKNATFYEWNVDSLENRV